MIINIYKLMKYLLQKLIKIFHNKTNTLKIIQNLCNYYTTYIYLYLSLNATYDLKE